MFVYKISETIRAEEKLIMCQPIRPHGGHLPTVCECPPSYSDMSANQTPWWPSLLTVLLILFPMCPWVSTNIFIPPANKVWGGYIGITLSVCLCCSNCVRAITSYPLVGSGYYFTQLLSMTQECGMTLTQGHISKVKVTVHIYRKSVSGP